MGKRACTCDGRKRVPSSSVGFGTSTAQPLLPLSSSSDRRAVYYCYHSGVDSWKATVTLAPRSGFRWLRTPLAVSLSQAT